jgi:hypothetical protein
MDTWPMVLRKSQEPVLTHNHGSQKTKEPMPCFVKVMFTTTVISPGYVYHGWRVDQVMCTMVKSISGYVYHGEE